MKQYTLYKGDEIIAFGTKIQLAKKLNVQLRTIEFYMTPTYKRRCENSKNRRVLVES